MKKFLISLLLSIPLLVSCSNEPKENLVIYNWGEYMNEDIIKDFEKETGINVTYAEYDSNENMYSKVKSNSGEYDIAIPSDYMIERMIKEDMLEKINFENIPNMKNIDKNLIDMSKNFDKENSYSIPYSFGTLGIVYNSKEVKESIDSFEAIFDKEYSGQILMIDSVRDAFTCALKLQGNSLNETNDNNIKNALELLKKQKPLVQAYANDQIRDKMISGEAKLGVYFSGDSSYMIKENSDLKYVVPKEGTNLWIDSIVILKGSKNKENAEKFINYLLDKEVAYKNYKEILIATPNVEAKELLDNDGLVDEILYPSKEVMNKCEVYKYLGQEVDEIYNTAWFDLRGE